MTHSIHLSWPLCLFLPIYYTATKRNIPSISHGPYAYSDLFAMQRAKEILYPSVMTNRHILTYFSYSDQKKHSINFLQHLNDTSDLHLTQQDETFYPPPIASA